MGEAKGGWRRTLGQKGRTKAPILKMRVNRELIPRSSARAARECGWARKISAGLINYMRKRERDEISLCLGTEVEDIKIFGYFRAVGGNCDLPQLWEEI